MWKQSAGCLLAAFETSSLHIVIVWYCLTCNRCSFSRFLYFSVYYYFYDLSYVIIFVLSSARKFFLCSIFSWHGSRCHFRTRTSIRWEIIAGDVLMFGSMNFIVSGMKKYDFFLSISFYVDSINKLNRKPYLQRPFVRESKIPLNQCVWCFEKFIRFNAAVGFVDNTLLISFLCNFISLVTKTIRRTLVKLLSSAKLYGMPLFFSSLRLEIVFHFEIGWNCAP